MSNITIQPLSADTTINSYAPTTPLGANTIVWVQPSSLGIKKVLLSVDFHASIPVGSTITAAILSLYDYSFASGRTLKVYRLLRTDWVEAEACWNYYKGTTAWGTAGASGSGVDFTTTDSAATVSPSSATWVSWNVKNQIQTALDSVGGIAHFLIADLGSDANASQNFYSKEATSGNATLRPTLYIEYTEYVDPASPALTLALTYAQVQERLTITLACAGAVGLPSAIIVVDGRAYTGLWTPGTTYVFTADLTLERGPHIIYARTIPSGGGPHPNVTTLPITYVMAYELAAYGIDVYSGDARLDAIEPVLHDELLPALPTLNFSCATLLTGTIQAVIRERGLRQYQFTIATVAVSDGIYTYTCRAAESYALTTAIMALQTSYGATSNAIALIAPSLNIIGASLLTQTTYAQLFQSITPVEIIKQLMIQALAQASVRNGNLYVFPLDVSAQTPDYHMQRLDPLTGWQKDADVYDAVKAHYVVKQHPTPDTFLTLHDAANWDGAVSDVTQVATTLLLPPSGALGMLKSVGNCSRAGLNAAFKDFDRVRFNWCPPDVGATVTISLQQDTLNKLELVHTFAGQSSSGFILNTGTVPADILTKNIALSPIQYVTKVTGTTTAGCSYRVTLLYENGATQWQDIWRSTIGNTFQADIPIDISHIHTGTVIIEFTNLYLVDGVHYGVQVITCDITVQTYVNVGSHVNVVSSVTYSVTMSDVGNFLFMGTQGLSAATSSQWYEVSFLGGGPCDSLTLDSEHVHAMYQGDGSDIRGIYHISVVATLRETIQDYAWVPSLFAWSSVFNLFEGVDIALSAMTRTGNPMNLATIALTFSGDNYVDTLVFIADNPLPVTVRAGTGSRAYTVTDDFGSEAGAQAYADGLLPIVSIAREQYTRDVSLATDLGVGDTISGDGVPMTVYAVDYRQDGKTLAAGKAMDTLMTRLGEQARRLGTLERKA